MTAWPPRCAKPRPEFKMKIERNALCQMGCSCRTKRPVAAATFIAANYNMPVDVEEFEKSQRILVNVRKNAAGCMKLYIDGDGKQQIHRRKPIKEGLTTWCGRTCSCTTVPASCFLISDGQGKEKVRDIPVRL